MAGTMANGQSWRSPFNRNSPSPSPLQGTPRPKSAILSPSSLNSQTPTHVRNQSFSPSNAESIISRQEFRRPGSKGSVTPTSNTFAPKFISSEEDVRAKEQSVRGIEGENDFSGKRYVWLKDPETAFVRGWIVEELSGDMLLVQCDDGSQREVAADAVDKVNPAKFDKADDMAELTHLNEASVVHNLHMRYQSDLIYTYSGLFLVTVNPYCPLPIYTNEYIDMYRGKTREDSKPHIFAMADEAFRNLVDEGENQSILVTGESGAGKTENTKKVIQYLAAVATSDSMSSRVIQKQTLNLSQQILRANPILEAFGNAQTVRNNNSSRFGKFIRIEFTRSGTIAGAFIDWYLLEKSRVVKLNSNERNYHVFYQLLAGAPQSMKNAFHLGSKGISGFQYMKNGNGTIAGVSDREEWDSLIEAFNVMGISSKEQMSILRTVAAVLHLGNIEVVKESVRADQARLTAEAERHAATVCELLGIEVDSFIQGLLHPRVKAGHEWVEKVQTPEQVSLSIDALAKGIYERSFGDLVTRINRQLNRSEMGAEDCHFIGVLDIAGFEIFQENSFEQLCINYTNEKLQQFFNHHMFVLEQEEYAREQIEWKFIDFGRDLQPTIDLIELPNPIGIFSCLDEDSVMPKATDKSFTEKLHSLWDRKTNKYRSSRLNQGFMLTHYAAEVEYSTHGWLEKNKDPLNDNITRLFADSSDPHVATLFADCGESESDFGATRSRVKKGLFRTVAQRHKEQLSSLMTQLHSTHPHFVRCIIPNHNKRPKQLSKPLVLDQLRCNGVLEGIRIARTGFPNRLLFSEFRHRYEVLCRNMPKTHIEGQQAAQMILEKLNMDKALYRVGLTKVFFRAGVLAELEEQRDDLIREIMSKFQSVSRGFIQRRIAKKRLYRAEATRIIQKNLTSYLQMCDNPWWNLYVKMKPLLGATRTAGEVKKRDETIQKMQQLLAQENLDRQKIEEERRRADTEMQRVQQTLESERALALDKEEIFNRLRARETELNEKLTGALEDQENLEDQLDELLESKKSAEGQAAACQKQLEQAGQIIARLEREKQEFGRQTADFKGQLEEIESTHAEKLQAQEHLVKEVKMLQSHVALKERKVQELESKLLKTDQELDLKLSATTKELGSTRKQIKDLLEENRDIRQQLTNLSSTSTDYEDLVRRKESELSVLRVELKQTQDRHKSVESERRLASEKHDSMQKRVREAQAEMEAMKSQKKQLEKEVVSTKTLLEAKISEDAKFSESRKLLDDQIDDLKAQLFQVQKELSRERQSRDDIRLLAEHEKSTLAQDFDDLNEAKITIEKELYTQQDTLRRVTEARNAAEEERREMQNELRKLRERYIRLEESRLQSESTVEKNLLKQAQERQASLRRELEAKEQQIEDSERERARLTKEVERLARVLRDSDSFKLSHDQHKERLEREMVTLKGRLTASENDNRALLNKIQLKNLDIARSNSRAGENHRSKVVTLQAEKSRSDEEIRHLKQEIGDLQLAVTSLEKQKEKLSLALEDMNHEITREHKTSRNAEKASSTVHVQLAEVGRNLESERHMKTQAQTNTRKVQATLDQTTKELSESRQQLLLLQKVFNPESEVPKSWTAGKVSVQKSVDLAAKLEASQHELQVAVKRYDRAELQLSDLRRRHQEELQENDERYMSSKRTLLEEIDQNNLGSRRSPKHVREVKPFSSPTTPVRRHISSATTATHDSSRSDKTVDTINYQKRMDLAAELEMVQNQLQMTEMQNRHLQSQLDRATPMRDSWQDESPSRRFQKLERENGRLHDMLDDSAKKVSALERAIQSGELSLRDIQTKSHQELYDLINSQEQSRKSLLLAHNGTVAEMTAAKAQFDGLKHSRAALEVELRDVKSELAEVSAAHDQDAANRNQILQDFSDLQIRLDTDSSKLVDVSASLNLYKGRADEYFNKLEQAEIAVLKATRAEQFAKSQAQEAEETCAMIMAERKQMDALVEDLQRQNQRFEERVEDMATDLDAVSQSKKRLQHELEDYRSQRAMDIEDKEMSMEQTRKKYQAEFSAITNDLDIERENVIFVRTENTRLRDELEDLRSKWDDEVLNSSTWAKEKSRLEMTLQDLSNSRDEASAAFNEAQTKIVSLLSQVRSLRSSVDDTAAERDLMQKEKRAIEARLKEANDRLEDLTRGENPAVRNAAGLDREILDLKSSLAQQEDVSAAAVGKMRRAEALAQEIQKDIAVERDNNVQLHKDKASLERTVKELQVRCVDLETKGYSSASQDVRFLHGRIQELEKQIELQETTAAKSQRSVRSVDRTVRDLQSQIDRRDKTNTQLQDEISKSRDKLERMLRTIDELQSSDSSKELQSRRLERELREEKEKALRLERELEGWKALRVERSGTSRTSLFGDEAGVRHSGDWTRPSTAGIEIPVRKASNSKGFL